MQINALIEVSARDLQVPSQPSPTPPPHLPTPHGAAIAWWPLVWTRFTCLHAEILEIGRQASDGMDCVTLKIDRKGIFFFMEGHLNSQLDLFNTLFAISCNPAGWQCPCRCPADTQLHGCHRLCCVQSDFARPHGRRKTAGVQPVELKLDELTLDELTLRATKSLGPGVGHGERQSRRSEAAAAGAGGAGR